MPGGTTTFQAKSTATGRYVLIWFTRLPPQAGGPDSVQEAEIFSIVVKGLGLTGARRPQASTRLAGPQAQRPRAVAG